MSNAVLDSPESAGSHPLEKRAFHPAVTNAITGILLVLCLFAALCFMTRDSGITWDEPYYLRSAHEIISFFHAGDFSDRELVKHFDALQWGDLHPAFAKALGALTIALSGGFQNELYAYRTANIFLGALTAGLIYLFVSAQFKSRRIGFLTALVCIMMPRVIGQMQFGETDSTLYALSFPAAISAYYSTTKKSIPWAISSGIVCGLCLSTRYPGLVVPLSIFLWSFFYHRERGGAYNLFFIPVLTPIVFVLLNPQFWGDPLVRAFSYLSRSSAMHITAPHFGFMFDFFDRTPWYYAPVMIFSTIPLLSLGLIVAGIVLAFRQNPKDDLVGLFAMLVVLPIFLVVMPGNVAYDGVRLFLLSFLYLGLFSAWAFVRFERWIRKSVIYAGMILLLLIPPAISHPFELEYYAPQIGGLWGAAKLRLELTYWWDAANNEFYRQANSIIPATARVSMFPADQIFLDYYRDNHRLNGTIVKPADSEYMVVLCRPSCTNARLHAFIAQWYKDPQILLRYPSRDIPFVVLLKKD
jgi:4-amino-4-deoxy-L-arabinose transferase-like glycosyltransferase